MRKIIVYTITIFIFLLPLWMWIYWQMTSPRNMEAFILDKTVMTTAGDNHKSFNFVLTNNKFSKQNGDLYDETKDYMGFFPEEFFMYTINDLSQSNTRQLDSLVKHYDMAYYTDMNGINYDEWFVDVGETKRNANELLDIVGGIFGRTKKKEHDKLVYGGLVKQDVEFLQKMKESKKLILTEFNMLAPPTKSVFRKQAEDMFGIRWTGWMGRYFDNLDTAKTPEVPAWLVHLYKNQNHNQWPFTKSGIVFIKDNNEVVILEKDKDLINDLPVVTTNASDRERFNVPERIEFPFWFDIIQALPNNHLVSEYELETTPEGDKILEQHKIPKHFPATVEHYKDDYKFYYFAGDFADNPHDKNRMKKMRGITKFRYFLYMKEDKTDRNRFFWGYYQSVVSTILNRYYDETKLK
ncbi:MAG: hypothetical protein IPP32_11265 [Bacteroidetes bacterium]|nr:hypothetical protein [Bacteroidota bacterium]